VSGNKTTGASKASRGWVIATIPIVVSVASLLISGVSFFFVLRTPQVDLEMPPFLSVWQPYSDDGSYQTAEFWVQPYFFYAGTSQRAEVVTDMRLFVDPKGDAGPIECLWLDQGGRGSKGFTLPDRTNPSPIVIDPSTAASPLVHFQAIGKSGEDWQITPGHYKLTLRADRAVSGEPLEAAMHITITNSHMQEIKHPQASSVVYIWEDTAGKPTSPTKLPEPEF
jgi:hypothetical protein